MVVTLDDTKRRARAKELADLKKVSELATHVEDRNHLWVCWLLTSTPCPASVP